jgi:hypothetical protein
MKSLLRTSGQQRTSGDSLTFSDLREIAKAISEPLSRGVVNRDASEPRKDLPSPKEPGCLRLTQVSDSSLSAKSANAETRDAVESVAGQRLTNNWSGVTLSSVISCNIAAPEHLHHHRRVAIRSTDSRPSSTTAVGWPLSYTRRESRLALIGRARHKMSRLIINSSHISLITCRMQFQLSSIGTRRCHPEVVLGGPPIVLGKAGRGGRGPFHRQLPRQQASHGGRSAAELVQ